MSIDIQVGANPLNVPQLNTGGIANMLDTTLLGKEIGSAIGDIPVITAAEVVTITGKSAGTIELYQNLAATGQANEVYCFVSGYENDTTTNQTGTYSIPFVTQLPEVAENTSGLTVSTTGTTLTITAPDAVTVFNGFISIKGVI
jgi:hypothetical protein